MLVLPKPQIPPPPPLGMMNGMGQIVPPIRSATIQWVIFGGVMLVGFSVLMYATSRRRRRKADAPIPAV